MNAMIQLTFLLLGLSKAVSFANPLTDYELTKAEHFCGSRLTQAMKLFCNPNVKNRILSFQKRSSDTFDQLWNSYDDDYLYMPNNELFDGYDSTNYGSYVSKRNYVPITAACCKSPCTLGTLVQYCN